MDHGNPVEVSTPMSTLEFGLDTFLPVSVDRSGHPISGDQAIRNAVEEAVLAEAVGIDSFNIGEHYRTEFMDSADILAAIASCTERIQLGSAVTVLSTQDPVRLYKIRHARRRSMAARS
jgi:alkanesulfonate monooxygenase SsuD/methylene tetrahydromethanopterin reductase-like flavin-dependent oxidoreductase (luciferase family)